MKVSGIPFVQGRNDYPDADGRKYGIAIHNTSNNASDTAEAAYATRRTDGVSSHFYCDKDSVTQSLDTDVRAGHAGSRLGNDNAIAVEITGANAWSRATWLSSVAWDALGRVLAQVCTHHGIAVRRASVTEMVDNPKVKAFYSHDDMRRAWGGTTHTDPGPGFPWDRLFAAVNAALGAAPVAPSTGDDGMTTYNEKQKIDATFNNLPSASLDTDGTDDGKGSRQDFPNHTAQAILALTRRVEALEAAQGSGGGGDGGGGISEERAREISREEISGAKVSPAA